MNRRNAITVTAAGIVAALSAAPAVARQSRLPELIRAQGAAYAAFCNAIDNLAAAEKCDDCEALAEAEAEYERWHRAEEDAVLAILSYRPISAADARAKVDFLGPINKKAALPENAVDALLESLLPAGEEPPDAFTGWIYEGGAS